MIEKKTQKIVINSSQAIDRFRLSHLSKIFYVWISKNSELFLWKSKLVVVRKSKLDVAKKSSFSKRARENKHATTRKNFFDKRRSRQVQLVQKKKIVSDSKVFIIVSLLKKKEVHIFKIKHLLSSIIICFFKSLNRIQSLREARRQKQWILRDFYHIYQDLVIARYENLDRDNNYRSSSFEANNSTTFNQVF